MARVAPLRPQQPRGRLGEPELQGWLLGSLPRVAGEIGRAGWRHAVIQQGIIAPKEAEGYCFSLKKRFDGMETWVGERT